MSSIHHIKIRNIRIQNAAADSNSLVTHIGVNRMTKHNFQSAISDISEIPLYYQQNK